MTVVCRKRTLFRTLIIEKDVFKVRVILAVSDEVVYRRRSLYMLLHNSPAIIWLQAPKKTANDAQEATLRVGYGRQLTGATAKFQALQAFAFLRLLSPCFSDKHQISYERESPFVSILSIKFC